MPPVFGRVAGGGVRKMEKPEVRQVAPYDAGRPTGKRARQFSKATAPTPDAAKPQFHRAPDREATPVQKAAAALARASTAPASSAAPAQAHAPKPLAFVKGAQGQVVEKKDPVPAPKRVGAVDHRALEEQLLRGASSGAKGDRNVRDLFMKIPAAAPALDGPPARDSQRRRRSDADRDGHRRRRRHITPDSEDENPLPASFEPHATRITLSDRIAQLSAGTSW